MDQQRFNELLLDPSKVENNDIRQLNEYRKKYPFFQGLYVVVAKALQERDHPKTDAFIKKAAIYSANRSHLKTIMESDDFFTKPLPKQKKEQSLSEQKKILAIKKEAHSPSEKQIQETDNSPKADGGLTAQKQEEVESHGDDPVINELKATKARIEALLRGELPQAAPEKSAELEEKAAIDQKKGPTQPKKNKQIEIIEKFIAEDPRIDIRQKAAAEADQEQEDLAKKSLANSEDFETETVAKLMIKQGKVKKGLAIYEKLHLKFPEKSSYFASQIQKIKSKHNV